MTVSTTAALATASLSQNSESTSGTAETTLDPNMFLKLLVAEIQNQDPTKPMDSTQLVQQLASLSQVQQSAQTNSKLATLLETMSIGQSAALVGRSLTSADGEDLGVVEAVRTTAQGLLARLQSGREVALGQGVTIRA